MTSVLWFKRDLRVKDQPALAAASNKGDFIAIYIFEPSLWQQKDISWRHYYFLTAALKSLHQSLATLGITLHVFHAEALDVFKELKATQALRYLFSCEETGNAFTYQRDIKIRQWCKAEGVLWQEHAQNGVVRGLKNRDGWAKRWAIFMNQPLAPSPSKMGPSLHSDCVLPSAQDLGLTPQKEHAFQQGGQDMANDLLDSFLNDRGQFYSKEMSSPVTAFKACSRLSTYLSFGCISMRQIFQCTKQKQTAIRALPKVERGSWLYALQSFLGRLRWHCHFIQKLEDEPSLEYQSLHPAYRSFDHRAYNLAFFEAWTQGKTGFPLLDACMRALHHTGWLNFRMRAMVVSVACHHLALPWTKVATYLATQFTDYEPGIHYSQCQMQAGMTGMNTLRIYSPMKQGYDQDPQGDFVRQWVPELAHFEAEKALAPWLYDWQVPPPIVDEKVSRKQAAEAIYSLRKSPESRIETQRLVKKHASRRVSKRRKKS